jgi:transposase
MTSETRKRREYTEDFKRDAVALVTEQGYKPSEAARSLGVGANLIRRWKREFEEEASGTQLSADEREELKRLRKEVRMLRMEKEILKNVWSAPGMQDSNQAVGNKTFASMYPACLRCELTPGLDGIRAHRSS